MIIAQLSDLHIMAHGRPAYRVADTFTALKRTVDLINRMEPAPDLVMITGDIADDGAPDSYEAVRSVLALLGIPFFLVPGNHDNKQALARSFPDHDYLAGRPEPSGDQAICYSLDEVSPGHEIEIIAMDTVFSGLHGGGMNLSRLQWLETRLEKAPTRPALIFMHHPPFVSGIGHMDQEPFARQKDLAGLLARHSRVVRLACGHIHRSIFTRFGSVDTTVCPAVGMQLVLDLTRQAPSCFIMEPPALMLHAMIEDWEGLPRLLTHISLVETEPGRFGPCHPFF